MSGGFKYDQPCINFLRLTLLRSLVGIDIAMSSIILGGRALTLLAAGSLFFTVVYGVLIALFMAVMLGADFCCIVRSKAWSLAWPFIPKFN